MIGNLLLFPWPPRQPERKNSQDHPQLITFAQNIIIDHRMVKPLNKVVRALALDGTWPERTNKQVPIQCQGLFPMSLINRPLDQLALIVNVVR